MSPAIRLLTAALAALMSLMSSPAGSQDFPRPNALVHVYTYDAVHAPVTPTFAHDEGPPADGSPEADGAVDHGSHGASACLNGATTYGYTDYVNYAQHVVANRTAARQTSVRAATTTGDVQATGGPLSSFQRLRVAAETAPELASGLERTGTALSKSDPFHRSVSWVVDNPAAQRFAIKGGDGVSRELYQLPGEVNGKSGVFEWIIDRSGTNPLINHQRFIPGGSVTGYPNQVVP